jgi:transposase
MRPGGVLMSDGYEPYAAIAEQHRLVHLGCWAHCRRYFNDALQAMPKDKRGPEQLPAQFIELIGRLYKVEADARRDQLDAQALQQRRTQHSKPVLEQIEALALQHLHGVLPGSLLGKALHYVTAQWPKLVRYVDDGRYPIDNNACENAIRPFVVGRRNWLFADTVGGANASANLYSLLQTCVANGIDGYRYLSALLVALPKAKTVEDYEALLPWRLAAADR